MKYKNANTLIQSDCIDCVELIQSIRKEGFHYRLHLITVSHRFIFGNRLKHLPNTCLIVVFNFYYCYLIYSSYIHYFTSLI